MIFWIFQSTNPWRVTVKLPGVLLMVPQEGTIRAAKHRSYLSKLL